MITDRKNSECYTVSKRLTSVTLLIAGIAALFIGGCGPRYQITQLEPAEKPVMGLNGMVVAAHPLAAEAGLNVLMEGGNAVDATLAALFMLNVVEPHASGLGGGGFALVRMADGESKVVIYRERAPKQVDTSFYYDPTDTLHIRFKSGGSAICTPGAPAGWAELFDRYSSGRFDIERLARDAIRAAEEGFPVDPTLANQIKNNYEKILGDSLSSQVFLSDGIPYEVGDILRQPDLAKTFRTLIKRGLRSFYRGPLAEAVVKASRSGGGFMTLDDLEFYRVEVTEPVNAVFTGALTGYEALTVPPPSSGGMTALEILHLFALTGALEQPSLSAEAVHLMSQCQQQAYADAQILIGDPRFVQTSWQEMSTVEFAGKATEGINIEAKPAGRSAVYSPKPTDSGNTTHLVVVDQWGNTVSLTQSINYFFGAGVMAPGTGLLMNNQMSDFGPPMDSLNVLAGGKMPRSNMTPLIILQNNKPVLVIGTPGGSRIPAAVAQISAYIIAHKMDIAAAIDQPRFFSGREHIVLETRFPEETLKELEKKGYKINLNAGPYHTYFGGAHGIVINPETGLMSGAADKRRGGAARGF